MKIAILSLTAILCGSLAIAGPFRSRGGSSWGTGGCDQFDRLGVPEILGAPAQVKIPESRNPGIEWKAVDGCPDEIALFQGGVQVGSWSYADGYWRDYFPQLKMWGPKIPTPQATPPARAAKAAKLVMPVAEENEPDDPKNDLAHQDNMGVDWGKISDHQATFNGRKISCDTAIELIGKQVPDDSKKFRLTVIGTTAEQKDALTQWASVEPAVKDRCNLWAVTADHWSLKDSATGQVAFKTAGAPVIYLQAPDGQVLHRQDDAQGFPEAIRKAAKAYDAAKDPDLRKSEPKKKPDVKKPDQPTPADPMHPAVPVCCLVGAAAVYMMMQMKKKAA